MSVPDEGYHKTRHAL